MKTIAAISISLLLTYNVSAEELREWKSITGTTINATVVSAENSQVTLKREDGTILTVGLDKLSPADQAYARKLFPDVQTVRAQTSSKKIITEGLTHPIGKVLGPIDAGDGSTYFLYIPTTLREGRKAPLLHFNGSGGGNAGAVSKHIEGAELNGWIVVANVQSRNGPGHPEKNHQHAKNTVQHAIETLPVDEERVYFTGGSGGGAMSFYNSALIKSAGAMPHIGYIPHQTTLKSGHFFIISGTNDYNRYHSAKAAEEIGKSAIHRFFVGPHHEGPAWLCTEGMTWLNLQYFIKNHRDSALADERLDFEAAILKWCEKLAETEAHRAYYWCDLFKREFQVSTQNQAAYDNLHRSLLSNRNNIAYVQGLKDISAFSKRHYPESRGSLFNHTTPAIKKAADKLAENYVGIPMIEEIARALGEPTCGQ